MAKPADLIAYVFEGKPHQLSGVLRGWMNASSRFTSFVETYRDKIRKKARLNREPENALDLLAELDVAYRLLDDRRLEVAYEPYASEKLRGPDFAVTYRANQVFNIEVARIRGEANSADALRRKEERILRILLGKLGQMQSGKPNLLAIHVQDDLARAIDLDGLMQALKGVVDAKDSAFYPTGGYSNPAAFYKDFLRLSGLLLWGSEAQTWLNKQSRPPLDEKTLRIVGELLQGEKTDCL